MRQLTSIVARNADGVIGARNRLPWRVKSDLSFFKNTTIDQVVVMGRKTHSSLGGCLPKRRNIVVTHGFSLFASGPECEAASSIEEALFIADVRAGKARQVFVVGGASMYEQFAPFVDRYLITEIDKNVSDADTYFQMAILGDPQAWSCRIVQEGQADNATGDEAAYRVFEYVAKDRKAVLERRREVTDRLSPRNRRSLNSLEAAAGISL